MPNLLLGLFVFAFGTVVGSFFNAVVWRFGREEKITEAHSKCVHCGHALAARDLIPLLSFLLLRGRCRYCGKPIPWRYPLVEVATGIVLLMLLAAFDLTPAFFLLGFVVLDLELLFLLDARYSVLPDSVTLPGIVLAVLAAFVVHRSFESALLGAILGGGFFLLQYVVSRGRWIGGGDIRLGVLMGVLLGWQLVLVALFLAYALGSVIGGALVTMGRKRWGSQVPFGTFLTVATFVALLWGEQLLDWYLNLIQ